jgi:hypothetical protein
VPPGHCEAVRLLLSKGVRVDPIDHRATPLHLAAAKDHDQVVKALLEYGADVSYLFHFHPHLTRVLDTYLCYGNANATNLMWQDRTINVHIYKYIVIVLCDRTNSSESCALFLFSAQQSCSSRLFTTHDGCPWQGLEMHEATDWGPITYWLYVSLILFFLFEYVLISEVV